MNRIIKLFLIIVFAALILSIFYYSWLPHPSFKSEKYLPNWLITWTNEYGIIRTGVPFIFLGFIANLLLSTEFTVIKVFLILLGVLLLAELGQLFLPNRSFDVLDIIVGIAATTLGQLAGMLFKKII